VTAQWDQVGRNLVVTPDDVMKQILADYVLAVVDQVAGRDLSAVLDPWLDQSRLPPLP